MNHKKYNTENLTPPSLLIVETEPAIRELLKACLPREYTYVLCTNAREAKTILQSSSFDLVITEIDAAGFPDFNLCDYIQRHCPHTAVIAVGSCENRALRLEAWRHGVFGFVSKPFDLQRVEMIATLALHYGSKRHDRLSSFFTSTNNKDDSQVSLKS